MSFLNELKKQKERLKGTETVVTRADGVKYLEGSGTLVESKSPGFVVDTKPDDVPVLIVDYLYIGSQDCAVQCVLEKYNIKHVLSLGIDLDISFINHKFVHILDLPESDVRPSLDECLPFLQNAIESKQNVLIHCNAGVSRTSMVAIAYLMQYQLLDYEKAYNFVKEKRPAIQPNAGFKTQLLSMTPGQIIS
ncbi:dual specificity protein phosphatase 19 [Vanessa tameamea]|uniref:Dual specificity protein phosphatase 19 n=1 Tax=Vanessa tameamea TaxID=334116 RepID=A0A8B8IWJ6_VANTA|nr:dual specificity protein phosphatase 19 [Vanessa tameamea]